MDFTVEHADSTLAGMIERGPQAPCWRGDEMCSFFSGGPCLALTCTCETTGNCGSCPPREPKHYRRIP